MLTEKEVVEHKLYSQERIDDYIFCKNKRKRKEEEKKNAKFWEQFEEEIWENGPLKNDYYFNEETNRWEIII